MRPIIVAAVGLALLGACETTRQSRAECEAYEVAATCLGCWAFADGGKHGMQYLGPDENGQAMYATAASKFVIRCRYVDYEAGCEYPMPEGVSYPLKGTGWLTKDARCTRDIKQAIDFTSEADAWTFLAVSGEAGQDEEGPYCWVEAIP